jgi:hypothetical protein
MMNFRKVAAVAALLAAMTVSVRAVKVDIAGGSPGSTNATVCLALSESPTGTTVNATVYYGPTNGGTDTTAWAASVATNTLSYGTVYCVTITNLTAGSAGLVRVRTFESATGYTNLAWSAPNFYWTSQAPTNDYVAYTVTVKATDKGTLSSPTTFFTANAAALISAVGQTAGLGAKQGTNANLDRLVINNGGSLTNLPSDGAKVTTNAATAALVINNGASLTNIPGASLTGGASGVVTVTNAAGVGATFVITNGTVRTLTALP